MGMLSEGPVETNISLEPMAEQSYYQNFKNLLPSRFW